MAVHEPLLHIQLPPREQEPKSTVFLECQDSQAVISRNINDFGGENRRGHDFCEAIEDVGDDPVEHLDQEWEFGEEAAVDVIGEAGGIRGVDCATAASPSLRLVFYGRAQKLIVIIRGRVLQ